MRASRVLETTEDLTEPLNDLPETFFQGFSFGLHYRFIEAVRGLSVLSENIRSRFGGHSSPGKSVDCESAVLVDKFRCLRCPRQDVLFSLGQMRPILRKNLPHVFVGDCQRRKSLRSAFRTSQSSGNILDSFHLYIFPAACTNDGLYLVEDSRLRRPNEDLAEFFGRNQVSLATDPFEANPSDRCCFSSYCLDYLDLDFVPRDRLQNLFRVGNVHIPLQGLTNSLVHDDRSLEALRELAKGYATEIRPFRNCSKSSRDMDEPALEQSCSLRCSYRHLVHLDLGESANHFHNIIGINSADSLEHNSVGILLDPDADSCFVG